jgi:hypothetical protein
MKYMFLIYGIERKVVSPEHSAFFPAAEDRGILLGAERLKSVETARTLRGTKREREIVDAPFLETARGLVGYYLLECEDLDEAIEWGWQIPMAEECCVEIRPVED